MKSKLNLIKEKYKEKNKILTACIGQCVHVAGTHNFINIAENLGFKCKFLGPAVSLSKVIQNINSFKPDIVGFSYRLTASTLEPILRKFFADYEKLNHKPERIFFAGTPEVIKVAKQYDEIDEFFEGDESRFEIIRILKNESEDKNYSRNIPMDLISRIEWKKPYPVIRAHFGLPDLDQTIDGIKQIANSKVLDIISIAPDQNTQENYFHPEEQDENSIGAGGVPIRSKDDFLKLHEARLTGNHPLLRIYAGTRDFIKLAELFKETINNAWAAIPIFWFDQMDGRGPLSLKKAIKQHLETIQWHGQNNIPVEINDSHHWSLRDAPDAIAVADMFLSGIIAKKLGVKHFIAQYMFNTPPNSSFDMDLAKMLAKNELLNTLVDDNFKVIKQVRTGLASFPLNLEKAKGQLAAASLIQLAIKPDIVHVVSYSEASHAALPEDIIESCNIVNQVIDRVYASNINLIDESIMKRKEELIKEAKWIIDLIPRISKIDDTNKDPYLNPDLLTKLVTLGIFDAPHLKNNKFALGKIKTRMIDGACHSWNDNYHKKMDEITRIKLIMDEHPQEFLSDKEFKTQLNKNEVKI